MKFNISLPQNKCRSCKFKKELGYTHHIECSKQNVIVSASEHGINNGWFLFPFNFDPIWLESCSSYRPSSENLSELDSKYLFGLAIYNISIFKSILEHNPQKAILIRDIFIQKDILNRFNSISSSIVDNDFSLIDRNLLLPFIEDLIKI